MHARYCRCRRGAELMLNFLYRSSVLLRGSRFGRLEPRNSGGSLGDYFIYYAGRDNKTLVTDTNCDLEICSGYSTAYLPTVGVQYTTSKL